VGLGLRLGGVGVGVGVAVDGRDSVLRVVGHRAPPRAGRDGLANGRDFAPRGDSTPSGEAACWRRHDGGTGRHLGAGHPDTRRRPPA
jgi:hypothetical protein